MIWESIADNNNRQLCHALSINEPDAECICFPGIKYPCSKGRSYQKHIDMKQRFVDHYNPVSNERDSNGKRGNRLGKCPVCDYEVVVAECGLSVLLDTKTINKVVDHMRLRHGIEMGNRFFRDPIAE
jgi:hypothetical protein